MNGRGFWIKGNLIVDITTKTHIDYVISNPEKFGLTKEEIQRSYRKHKEHFGSEGNAREEIVRSVSSLGWIRVRQYKTKQNEYWSIQFDVYSDKNKKAIKNFIEWIMLEQGIMKKNDEVVLTGFKDNTYIKYGFSEGGVTKFLTENKNIKVDNIIELCFYE